MRSRWRWLAGILLTVAVAAGLSSVAAAAARPGPLSGTWSGELRGAGGYRRHMIIVVNAAETAGSWRISATCSGSLTLDSISNGYHHFRRRRGRDATCAGGDIDCLKRAGAGLYDAVTSRPGGAYDVSGSLRRARRR